MTEKKCCNILFIERKLAPDKGGVEKVTYVLSRELEKKFFKVFYCYVYEDYSSIDSNRKIRIDLNRNSKEIHDLIKNFIKLNQITVVINQNVYHKKLLSSLEYLQKKYGLNLIFCQHSNPDMWVNKTKFRSTTWKIYFNESIKELIYKIGVNPHKKSILQRYKLANKYILLSNTFIDDFKKLYHVDGEKLLAIPNPCSFNYKYNINDIEKKKNIILVVARIAEQQKRISNVLIVWNKIFKLYPDWIVKIVGEGSDLKYYQKIVQKKHIERIYFEGQQQNTAPYYQEAKIFLMTSIWEGQPMTILESMYNGCVPIVFDTFSSIHDIIVNGKNGLIIPYWNIDQYINKVKYLIENSSILKAMQVEATQSIKKNFMISNIADKWEILLTKISGNDKY